MEPRGADQARGATMETRGAHRVIGGTMYAFNSHGNRIYMQYIYAKVEQSHRSTDIYMHAFNSLSGAIYPWDATITTIEAIVPKEYSIKGVELPHIA